MKNNSIYLKYKRERRLLKDLKNYKLMNREARVLLKRANLRKILRKQQKQKKQSLLVSLPIKHFNKIEKKKSAKMNKQNPTEQFKIPKLNVNVSNAYRPNAPTNDLRMVRHVTVAGTATGKTMVKNSSTMTTTNKNDKQNEKHIKPSNKEIDTVIKSVEMTLIEREGKISIKHKLPVSYVPTKGSYRITHREVNSANEIKQFRTDQVHASSQTDTTEEDFETIDIVKESGLSKGSLIIAIKIFKRINDVNSNDTGEVIDLDEITDKNSRLLMAIDYSNKNKKIMKVFSNRAPKVCNRNPGQPTEGSRPACTPTPAPEPMDPELQKYLHTYFLPVRHAVLRWILNSKNNKNKQKTKIIATEDDYNETNMDMEVDIPVTQNIVNHPNVVIPLVNGQNLQQNKNETEQVLQQNKQVNMPLPHLSPAQQQLRQDQLQQKQLQIQLPQQFIPQKQMVLQKQQQTEQQKAQQQQRRLEQIQSHQTQTSQFENAQLEQPQLQHTWFQQSQQHPINTIQRQQCSNMPQEHTPYALTNINYPNTTYSHVNPSPSMHSTQRTPIQLFPGDPRIQSFQARMPRARPGPSRLMSTYEANLQTSSASHPPQHNYWGNQHYW